MSITIDGTTGISGNNGSAGTPAVQGEDTNTGIFFPAADTVAVATAGTERVRVDSSGNVGIGINNPLSPLHVYYTNASTYGDGTAAPDVTSLLSIQNGSQVDGTYSGIRLVSESAVGTSGVWTIASVSTSSNYDNHLVFNTRTGSATYAERMRIDASGNVGIGVAPSAWATLVPAIQLGGGGSFIAAQGSGTANSDSIYIGTNAHFDGTNWKYKETNHASYFLQANGVHQWFTAPSGTAGNAITFTQAMTLDASGNLLVGTTSQINGHTFKSSEGVSTYRPTVNAGFGIHHFYSDFGSTQSLRAYFTANGGLSNFSANNVNLSDERVKTDIFPVGSYWDKVKALQVVTYKYRDQGGGEDNIGVIAQQVESVAPEFVCTSGFGETPADGVPLKSIYETDLHYATLKALQEAMARIEELTARVAELEAK